MSKRKNHSPDFKAKEALEALKGEQDSPTLQPLLAKPLAASVHWLALRPE